MLGHGADAHAHAAPEGSAGPSQPPWPRGVLAIAAPGAGNPARDPPRPAWAVLCSGCTVRPSRGASPGAISTRARGGDAMHGGRLKSKCRATQPTRWLR